MLLSLYWFLALALTVILFLRRNGAPDDSQAAKLALWLTILAWAGCVTCLVRHYCG